MIPPPIPIQYIAMLPDNSVVKIFASAFQGVPKVFSHAPVFLIEETTFLMDQMDGWNDIFFPVGTVPEFMLV